MHILPERDYFCGWYCKCQSATQAIALIPAYHRRHGALSASLQVVTETQSFTVPLPPPKQPKTKPPLLFGTSYIGENGLCIRASSQQQAVNGVLRFSKPHPLSYDIMGPFCALPFMECRHSVLSMCHCVNGSLTVNGQPYTFHNAQGYLEGDRGYSFPKQYAWSQCFFTGGSLMLCTADIPIGRFRFTGVLCSIRFHGKEYRLATYLGAKAVKIRKGELIIRQDDLILSVKLFPRKGALLQAPQNGEMSRTIRETLLGRAYYCLRKGKQTLFSFETSRASFEYEYPF